MIIATLDWKHRHVNYDIQFNKCDIIPKFNYWTMNNDDLIKVANLERYILSDPKTLYVSSEDDEYMYVLIDKMRVRGTFLAYGNYTELKKSFSENVIKYYISDLKCICDNDDDFHNDEYQYDSNTIYLMIEYGYKIVYDSKIDEMTNCYNFKIPENYLFLYAKYFITKFENQFIDYPRELFFDPADEIDIKLIDGNPTLNEKKSSNPTIVSIAIYNDGTTIQILKHAWKSTAMCMLSSINHILDPGNIDIVMDEYYKRRRFPLISVPTMNFSDCIFKWI